MADRSAGVSAPATRTAMSATPPFVALPTAPGLARGHVRATLASWGLGELTDTAELIASEMTANTVKVSAPRKQPAMYLSSASACLPTETY